MAKSKELVPYSTIGSFKSKIRVSGQKLRSTGKKLASKATSEQKFLGKTLPKTLFKVAKFAIKRPLTATGLFLVPDVARALIKKGERVSGRPVSRTFDRKGRSIL
jgi:hypothetical protein